MRAPPLCWDLAPLCPSGGQQTGLPHIRQQLVQLGDRILRSGGICHCGNHRHCGLRTGRASRGDVKRKVAINPQTMGNYKKIKSITLRMEPSGTTWAAFLRGQAGKEEIYQVEILLCILCNKLKLRRCVNG